MHLQYLTPQTQSSLIATGAESYTLAVALAAGFAVPVPTAAVEDIEAYLGGASEEALARVVGIFNEVRPLDCENTLTVAKQVWKARYEVAHGLIMEKVEAQMAAATPLDLFGIGFCLSHDTAQALCTNAGAIMPVLGACIRAARQITVAPEA